MSTSKLLSWHTVSLVSDSEIVRILKMKVKSDHHSKFSNFSNWKRSLKNIRASTGFKPVTSTIPVRCSTQQIDLARNELNKLTSLPMCGFTAQLVEHHTGIAKVTGLNPIEARIFFRLLPSNCLNWKIYCDDHSSLSFTTAVQIWISYIFHIVCILL